jgi:hypothetical protein
MSSSVQDQVAHHLARARAGARSNTSFWLAAVASVFLLPGGT